MNEFEVQRLLNNLKQISKDQFSGESPGGFTRATLTSLNPLTFQITSKLKVSGHFIVTPKYRVFTEEDIGKDFVFFKDLGGQTYYYAYEPQTPQGANGESYHFKGKVTCNLTGTCPEGTVTITGGTIEDLEHERRV